MEVGVLPTISGGQRGLCALKPHRVLMGIAYILVFCLFVLRERSVNIVKGGTEENRIHIINQEHSVNFFLPNTFLLKF